MTKYLELTPQQEPGDLGLDDQQRQLIFFNAQAVCRPTSAFLEEVRKVLTDASVIASASIFLGARSTVPTTDGPFVTLIETGGAPPLYTQNERAPSLIRPSVQVMVRAKQYSTARATARAAWNAVNAVINQEVTA